MADSLKVKVEKLENVIDLHDQMLNYIFNIVQSQMPAHVAHQMANERADYIKRARKLAAEIKK